MTSPFEAIEQAARTKPDLRITSALMDGFSGIDLVSALRGMDVTSSLSVALLTSMSKDDPHLRSLPSNVPVIYKGHDFGDDLANALETLGFT